MNLRKSSLMYWSSSAFHIFIIWDVLGVSWKTASQGIAMTRGIIGDYLDVFGVGLSIRKESSGKVYDIYTTIIPILLLGNLEMV
jgi:hypothetical protein